MRVKRFRSRQLAGAVGAVAAGLGGAGSADAGVVYQLVNVAIPPDYNVDLNGDAIREFVINHYVDAAVGDNLIKATDYATGAGSLRDGGGRVANLAAGTLIGPGSGVYTSAGEDNLTGLKGGAAVGNFQVSNGPGFIGLQFLIGADTHYGYVGYEGTAPANTGSGRVYSLAYESVPLTPIVAGAVPEPSSLALLAAGAVGVTAYRRRRTA
ncbi:MAG: PEP-CTERM sorting domain-containing protein [Pirellulales bacterium]|nr:PEP-CTERM sorting domain-containing protein [Pirellulales bacterium]